MPGVERQSADLDRPRGRWRPGGRVQASSSSSSPNSSSARAPRWSCATVAAATFRASATGATSCTRNTRARARGPARWCRWFRCRRSFLRSIAGQLADEALRELPITTGRDRRDLIQVAQQLEVVLDGLAEADPRIEPHVLLRHTLGNGKSEAFLQKGPDIAHHVVVARVACMVRGSPSIASGSSRRRGATRPASSGKSGRPSVVHEGRARLKCRLRNLELRGVDRDPMPAVGKAAPPQHAAQLLPAGQARRPAGWTRRLCRGCGHPRRQGAGACVTAASASRKRAPSEKSPA